MKKLSKIFVLICVLFCSASLLCACDLSHKHYLDDYGICRSCRKDVADKLSLNANLEYISNSVYGKANYFVYFKFISKGESSISITIEEGLSLVSYIEFYTKSVNYLNLSHTSGENSYFYNSPLKEGETYYIRARLLIDGTVKIKVSPM